jgi:excinuclease ABC subunit C
LDKKDNVIYIGKAKNLKKRVAQYFLKNLDLGIKTNILVSQIEKIRTIAANSEIEAFLLEAKYIKKYKPKFNIKLLDDKAYPMVKINIKSEYPSVMVVRKYDDRKSAYFGPYPNGAKALRMVLKTIRRIFPYQSVLNHGKRICLYNHIGLCPCPCVVSSKENNREYRKTIRHIVNFLNGNTKKIIKDLEKERMMLSDKEEYEKASFIQNKLEAIELITSDVYKRSFDANIDPNLNYDLRQKDLSNLKKTLNANDVKVKNLSRIECFDISNTSGTNATGSMVVFTNGEKDTGQYRRFKIKSANTPNDFLMMQEILQRRLKHKEWHAPGLIIVDGGKGQISSAVKALKTAKSNTPLVGLAKREEIIITSDFQQINLSKNSPELKLVMRIRDEAHRFAITYHRKLRSKAFTPHPNPLP